MSPRALRYQRVFDPDRQRPDDERATTGFGDRRDAADYVYSEKIVLAVNVALAARRPLLVRGAAGSGKSSLAEDVARRMGWDFYVEVISSRTQARDLLWTFDAVRRLRDAQAQQSVEDTARYVRAGVLWWALDPRSAADHTDAVVTDEPLAGAVVLLDEIDKAELEAPNDLLVPLGAGAFSVSDLATGRAISLTREHHPLVMVTTNDERELSPAFVRRCVVLELPDPDAPWLVRVADAHFGPKDKAFYTRVAEYVMSARIEADLAHGRPPSTAEFLDALYACRELRINTRSRAWEPLAQATLRKWTTPREPG